VHTPDVRVEAAIYRERAEAVVGDIAYTSAWAAGMAMTLDQVLAYALLADGQTYNELKVNVLVLANRWIEWVSVACDGT
jgi:hypothetical protein